VTDAKIGPDGATLDRLAEFVFETPDRFNALFSLDPEGYYDAIGRLVQALASGQGIVGGTRKAAIQATDDLKKKLIECSRLEMVEFFDEENRAFRRRVAEDWLETNWSSIVEELKEHLSTPYTSLEGHLRREFLYRWTNFDPRFAQQYNARKEEYPLLLPEELLKRLSNSLAAVAGEWNIHVEPKALNDWITENVSTHYRIFGEFWLFFGKSTGHDYEPARTRASLRFLSKDEGAEVEELVMPFIGLAAVNGLKDRSGLIDHVAGWTAGKGQEVVHAFREFRSIVRAKGRPEERQAILNEAERILREKTSLGFNVSIRVISVVTKLVAKKGLSTEDVEKIAACQSRSARWLWKLRNADVEIAWRSKIRELAGLP
jgi:hypothetical protein